MRLWHQDLISKLPRQQLLGQHRECCALRGNGWGKKHSTVDYIYKYGLHYLVEYHALVMEEMEKRGYIIDQLWWDASYRGKSCGYDETIGINYLSKLRPDPIYPEHNDDYMCECVANLSRKGVEIAS